MGRLSVDFPHLLFQNPALEHPPTVWPLAGTWNMTSALADAAIVGANHGTWSGTALVPDAVIPDSGNMSAAFTGNGIPSTPSSGTQWMGPLVVPTIQPSDNVVSYGAAFLDENTTPEMFEALMIESASPDPIFGNWLQVSASGFQVFPVIAGVVQTPVSGNWLSPAAPGDQVFVGIDFEHMTVVVQKGSGPVQQAGPLGILGIPAQTSLYGLVYMTFATSHVAFQAGSLAFTAAATGGGHNPMQTSGDATPPADAADGKQYLVTHPGIYHGYRTLKGDRVRFENNLQDLWISRLPPEYDHDLNPVIGLEFNPTDHVLTISMRDGSFLQTDIPTNIVSLAYSDQTGELTVTMGDGSSASLMLPPGVTGMSYEQGTQTLTLTLSSGDTLSTQITVPPGVTAMAYTPVDSNLALTLGDNTVLTANIAHGFVAIADITPTNPSDNVGNKTMSDDGNVFVNGLSSTHFVRVSVIAMSGMLHFKPTVTLGLNTPVPLSRVGVTDLWSGYVDLDTQGANTISVRHGEGPVYSATLQYELPPVVQSVVVSDPNLQPGQADYLAGQTFEVTVTADVQFTAIEFADESGSATTAYAANFPAVLSRAQFVTAAARTQPGGVPVSKYLKVRVKAPSGTWSPWFTTANIVSLDNIIPTLTFQPIVYPVGQSAIKGGDDPVTVAFTPLHYTGVAIANPPGDLLLVNATNTQVDAVLVPGTLEYNLDAPNNNVEVTLTKLTNASSAVFTTTVAVASIVPVISVSITGSPARLQSGPVSPATGYSGAPAYTVTVRSLAPAGGQNLVVNSLDAGIGTWQGAGWSAGHTPSRALKVFDTDPKGVTAFSNLSVTNPAGIVVTAISAGANYTVGGFVRRPVYFPVQSREAIIGTPVVNTAKLKATNLSKGVAGTFNVSYAAATGNDPLGGPFTYTITGPSGVANPAGDLVYNNDQANVLGNNDPAHLLTFEIEETP